MQKKHKGTGVVLLVYQDGVQFPAVQQEWQTPFPRMYGRLHSLRKISNLFSHDLQFSFFKLSLNLRFKIGSYLFCLLTQASLTSQRKISICHSFHLFVFFVFRYRRNISAMGCSLTLQGKIGNFVNPISLTPLNAIFADRPQLFQIFIF